MFLGGVLVASSACSLLLSTTDLSGGSPGADQDGGQEEVGRLDARPSSAEAGSDAPSCRALRDLGVTASGTYTLRRDGGSAEAYCEMESFDGGWTLVTKDMIASETAVQDIAPDSPARVSVNRTTDAHGGIGFSVNATVGNCGAAPGKASPSHVFTIADVEPWSEIMATYSFGGHVSCWHLFGDPDGPDTNLRPFDLAVDRFDRDVNMARASNGSAIRFAGTLKRCDEAAQNFWLGTYRSSTRGIRTVQRRLMNTRPFGLGVGVDCVDQTSWEIREIYVR